MRNGQLIGVVAMPEFFTPMLISDRLNASRLCKKHSINYMPSGSKTMAKQPNIIFIMSDDHAANAISGSYGSRVNKTPNIDRLANEGHVWIIVM